MLRKAKQGGQTGYKDAEVIGRGTSTDIIEASAKAYVSAINKLLSKPSRRRAAITP